MFGYRTENIYGEGYSDPCEVITHEIFELENTDIIDTLCETILKDSPYKDELITLSDIISGENDISNDELESLLESYQEDESIAHNYVRTKILDEITRITGKRITYVLWLCDSIQDIIDSYQISDDETHKIVDFDAYLKSDIVISDIGRDGKLYGYEKEPKCYDVTKATCKNNT